jgi:hypothetical protein
MTFSLRSLVDGLVFLYGLFVWTPRVEGICVVLNLLMSTAFWKLFTALMCSTVRQKDYLSSFMELEDLPLLSFHR